MALCPTSHGPVQGSQSGGPGKGLSLWEMGFYLESQKQYRL